MRRKKTLTHQNDHGDEHYECEKVSWLIEAGRIYLKGSAVCVKKVWIEEYAQLGSCEKEGCGKTPYLRIEPLQQLVS